MYQNVFQIFMNCNDMVLSVIDNYTFFKEYDKIYTESDSQRFTRL